MKIFDKALLGLGIFFAGSELVKQILLTFILGNGHYDWWYLPFQLCSLPIYLISLAHFSKRSHIRQVILTFLATYNLLGGAAAFLDTSGMHYAMTILTVHSYVWHILLIFTGILAAACLFFQSKGKMSWKTFIQATALFLMACLMASVLNLVISPIGSIDMFYINPLLPMEQIVFRDIGRQLGNTAAIILYMGTIIAFSGLLFFIWQQAFKVIRRRGLFRYSI